MDLAPALAVRTGYPLATDCVDIIEDGLRLKVVRQIYNGRLFARMAFREATAYLITVRSGSFSVGEPGDRQGEVVRPRCRRWEQGRTREFLEYRDTGKGEVGCHSGRTCVCRSRHRGGGQRPRRQGTRRPSGRRSLLLAAGGRQEVVAKVPPGRNFGAIGGLRSYLALGISGAYQHVAGISGAGTIVAVNRQEGAHLPGGRLRRGRRCDGRDRGPEGGTPEAIAAALSGLPFFCKAAPLPLARSEQWREYVESDMGTLAFKQVADRHQERSCHGPTRTTGRCVGGERRRQAWGLSSQIRWP